MRAGISPVGERRLTGCDRPRTRRAASPATADTQQSTKSPPLPSRERPDLHRQLRPDDRRRRSRASRPDRPSLSRRRAPRLRPLQIAQLQRPSGRSPRQRLGRGELVVPLIHLGQSLGHVSTAWVTSIHAESPSARTSEPTPRSRTDLTVWRSHVSCRRRTSRAKSRLASTSSSGLIERGSRQSPRVSDSRGPGRGCRSMDHPGPGPHRVRHVREVAFRMGVRELEDEVVRVGGVLGEGVLT